MPPNKNKNLLIVESPTKANTIQKFLGKDFSVLSSFGHIRDLPEKSFGVDIENNFEPKYVIPKKAKKIIQGLAQASRKAETVILASVDYKEPILIQCPDNLIRQFEVGAFIDEILKRKIDFSKFKVLAFNSKSQRVSFKPIKGVSRHPVKEKILEVELDYGRKIRITPSHSVFTKDNKGEIKTVLGEKLKIGDRILVPLKLPHKSQKIKEIDFLKVIYKDKILRRQVFINSPKVIQYQREKVLAPKTGNIPQFQPRIILSSKLRKILKHKRRKLKLSQKSLAQKIGCSQPEICEWERGSKNPTLPLGKKYLNVLGFNLQKVLKNPGAKIVPSSIEMTIKNALENQWSDSRKSLTHTWQPLSRFTWKEIEKNFKTDREIKISRHNHSHLMPRYIPVNEDLMLFLGFFVAEGSYAKNGNAVRFSFGKKTLGREKENIERVKKISQNLFNLSPSDFEERTSNSVVLSSSLVIFLLKNVFGIKGEAESKEVPWIVFNVSSSLQLAFLEGLFLGDGSLGKGQIVFNTVSPKLAQGLRFLLLQNRIIHSHSINFPKRPNRKPLHYITICGKERLSKIKSVWGKHYKAKILDKYLRQNKNINNSKKNWSLVQEEKGDLGLLKIRTIRKVKASNQFVYDFSVKGENFICGDGGVCAHNTDEDREGEAIAWHLAQVLKLGKSKPYERIVFHEITKKAIEEALKHPREIDMDLVSAQKARRILDRIVGYRLSPLLWKKVARRLSAGRVQSVAVRLIVEREREIENFIPQEYWTITALLAKNKNKFEALLVKKDKKPIPKLGIKSKKEAEEIVKDLKGKEYVVKSVQKKEIQKNPPPPFITSTLQQEAWKRLKFSAKKTMFLAQNLYEKGHITYHRTDSLNISKLALSSARNFIAKNLGKEYWRFRIYKTKSKVAQEAHEAIRPTYVSNTPKDLKEKLERDELRLYDLIWRRFLATQMKEAIFDSVSVEIEAKNYGFLAGGQTLKFDGFLKVYPIQFEEKLLPELKKGEKLKLEKLLPKQHFTQPPPRYNEASLIKVLEQNGIGRPSTYAPIISTIQERNYVRKDQNRKFRPTEIGMVVNDLLVKHFPEIVDIKFTARMEEELDEIAQGKKQWTEVIRKFYEPFEANLKKKEKEISKEDIAQEKTDKVCPLCGAPLIIRLGKFGRFYACSNFPKCKYTESLEENQLKVKCPKCKKGEIVEKRTKKGKIFYGCSNWPDCDFALWDKPIGEFCPKCGWPLVKSKKDQIKCSNPECHFIKN